MFVDMSRKATPSETQGRSIGPGEKRDESFQAQAEKLPGYRLSPDHFQTVKRMLAPDWAQKMFCIIVPNRQIVSPKFFSWVRYFLATVAQFVHQAFLTRNEDTNDESKNSTEKILFLKGHNVS